MRSREGNMGEAKQSHASKSVSYRGSLRDMIYFIWYQLTRSPGLVAIDLLVAGCVTWIVCSSLEGFRPVLRIVTCVLFFTITFAGLFLLGFVAGALRALFVRDRTFFAENTIEIYDDHFVGRNSYATTEFKWTVVHKLRRTRQYIVASIAPGKAILIPRRAFTNREDWDSFYEFFRSHCEQSAIR